MKYKFLLAFAGALGMQQATAQELATGTHAYKNANNQLTIQVGDDVMECTFTISLADGTKDSGTGTFRQAVGSYWYELHGEKCNYSFDDPYSDVNTIEVEIYDCKNSRKDSKLVMTRGV